MNGWHVVFHLLLLLHVNWIIVVTHTHTHARDNWKIIRADNYLPRMAWMVGWALFCTVSPSLCSAQTHTHTHTNNIFNCIHEEQPMNYKFTGHKKIYNKIVFLGIWIYELTLKNGCFLMSWASLSLAPKRFSGLRRSNYGNKTKKQNKTKKDILGNMFSTGK